MTSLAAEENIDQKLATQTAPQQQPSAIEHQQLIQILLSDTSLDEQLGSTLKTFCRIQRQDALIDQLTVILHKKEQEIEKLCNSHYQEFIHSVDELLKVRSDAETVKQDLHQFDQNYQKTGQNLLALKQKLSAQRKAYINVETASNTLKACLFILELANKINFLIEQKKYYSALKTLEEMQNYHLNSSLSQFEFVKHVQECIPSVQNYVKSQVLAQLKEWFVTIREQSRIVGKIVMSETSKRETRDPLFSNAARVSTSLLPKQTGEGTLPVSISRENLSWESLEAILNEEDEIDVFHNNEVNVDFRPLYQCIHIHDVLGLKGALKGNYDENRRLQANLILKSNFSLSEKDVSGFENYLNEIVGFFAVEQNVVSTTEGFRSKASLDSLWDMASNRLYDVISVSLKGCENPEHFLKIKDLMTRFIKTMEEYGFTVNRLIDLLMAFFESYSDLKIRQAAERCEKCIESDDGSQVEVHTMEKYMEVLKIMKYRSLKKDELASSDIVFPCTFPFSDSFLSCCTEIKDYINGFYKFAEGFHQHYGEMDDILKHGVETLITKKICASMEKKLLKTSVQLPEIVRTILNLEVYTSSIREIEKLISQKRHGNRVLSPKNVNSKAIQDKKITASLAAACQIAFSSTRKKAENRIFDVVNRKIDDFTGLASYDFCPIDASTNRAASPTKLGARGEPSQYLSELVGFLKIVWDSTLGELPESVKSLVYFDAIYHLAAKLLSLFMDQNVKRISPYFVEKVFMTDYQFLEGFVQSLGDPSLPDNLLELKQATVLMLPQTNVEEYLNAGIRSKKYSRVSKQFCLRLIEKVRDSGVWFEKSMFSSLSFAAPFVNEDTRVDIPVKRKQIDHVIKTLKEETGKK
jgi:hypothetical protein